MLSQSGVAFDAPLLDSMMYLASVVEDWKKKTRKPGGSCSTWLPGAAITEAPETSRPWRSGENLYRMLLVSLLQRTESA